MSHSTIQASLNSARHSVRSLFQSRILKSTLSFVFLMSAVGTSAFALQTQTGNQSMPAANLEKNTHVEVSPAVEADPASEPQPDLGTQTGPSPVSSSQSVKVESSVINGVADTSVEVNGQEVPVQSSPSSSQTVIQNDGQSVTNITTNNSQSSSSASTYSTNTSSSFSHSFNSSTVREN